MGVEGVAQKGGGPSRVYSASSLGSKALTASVSIPDGAKGKIGVGPRGTKESEEGTKGGRGGKEGGADGSDELSVA